MKDEERGGEALVPAYSTGLSGTSANWLVTRARADLHHREEAKEWLRKGIQLLDRATEPFGPKLSPQLRLSAQYIRRILLGSSPDSAAAALDLSPEDQEFAHTIYFLLPETLAELTGVELPNPCDSGSESVGGQPQEFCTVTALRSEAFRCFEHGRKLDPTNPELLYQLARCYQEGIGVAVDEERADFLYRRAANLGHSDPMTARSRDAAS